MLNIEKAMWEWRLETEQNKLAQIEELFEGIQNLFEQDINDILFYDEVISLEKQREKAQGNIARYRAKLGITEGSQDYTNNK